MNASETRVAPPAGWYHDPLGLPQYRYWDGEVWTNQVRGARRPDVAA